MSSEFRVSSIEMARQAKIEQHFMEFEMSYWRTITTLAIVALIAVQSATAQSPYAGNIPAAPRTDSSSAPATQFNTATSQYDKSPAPARPVNNHIAAPAYPTSNASYAQRAPLPAGANRAAVAYPGTYAQQPNPLPTNMAAPLQSRYASPPPQAVPIPTSVPAGYAIPASATQTSRMPVASASFEGKDWGRPVSFRQQPQDQLARPSPQLQGGPQAPAVNPEGRYTINELIALAETNNPILQRALEKIESARGDVVQASLYPNPRFETNNPEVFAGRQSAINFGYQQDIVVKGKIRLSRDVANQVVEQMKANFRNERFNLLTRVRQQAFVCMASERRVEVLHELANIAAGTRDAAIKLEKAGEGSQTDVLFLATEFERADVSYLGAVSISEGDHKELAAIIGMPDLAIKDIVGDITSTSPVFDEEYLKYFVTSGHALVAAANAEIARTTTQVRRDEVEAYPNPRMGPHYQQGVSPNTSQGWFTIQFDIPVWNRNQGNIRQARAEARGAAANRTVVQNELLRQAADAVSRYRAAKQVAERIQTVILPNAIRTQQLVKDGYARRVVDVTRLLQAQRLLTDTQINYIDASERLWLNAAEIAGLMQLENFP